MNWSFLVAVSGEGLRTAVRNWLGPPLRACEAPLDRWLSAIGMHWAQVLVIGYFLAAGAWVWTLRRETIFQGAPSQSRWCDLRIWTTLLLVPYVAVYWFLGR